MKMLTPQKLKTVMYICAVVLFLFKYAEGKMAYHVENIIVCAVLAMLRVGIYLVYGNFICVIYEKWYVSRQCFLIGIGVFQVTA